MCRGFLASWSKAGFASMQLHLAWVDQRLCTSGYPARSRQCCEVSKLAGKPRRWQPERCKAGQDLGIGASLGHQGFEREVLMSFPSSGGWCFLLLPGQCSEDVLQRGGGICSAWKASQGPVCFSN